MGERDGRGAPRLPSGLRDLRGGAERSGLMSLTISADRTGPARLLPVQVIPLVDQIVGGISHCDILQGLEDDNGDDDENRT